MKGLLALILVLTGGFALAETTFEDGTFYSATTMRGNVWVQCASEPTRLTACAGYDLEPGVYTRLVSDANADRFEVEALHADGDSTKKKGKFYSEHGTSAVINLWIRSLFQRPLLAMGENIVRYTLTKNGNVVEQGEFVVTVEEGRNQVCRTGTIYSSGHDCGSTSRVCDLYFDSYCN